MRYALFALALACSAVAGTAVLAGMARPAAQDGHDWRRQELVFLKAAYDRMLADLQAHPSGSGILSLRREQASLVQRMAEVAGPLSADQLPDGVVLVLPAAAAPKPVAPAAPTEAAAKPAAPVVPTAAAVPRPSIRLRAGLAVARPAEPKLDGIELDAALRAPLHYRKAARKPPEGKAAEAKPPEAKAAETKAAKVATADPH